MADSEKRFTTQMFQEGDVTILKVFEHNNRRRSQVANIVLMLDKIPKLVVSGKKLSTEIMHS